MSSFEVIVYSSTGCPYCEKVKKQLTEWGVEYEVRNVSIHKEYFDQLRANKIFGTPATYVNGKLILGFQEKKFKKAFGIEDKEANQES
jgi:glutaredoxin